MSLRPDPADPSDPTAMTADERRDEVAAIFARGILRLHGRVLPNIAAAEILPESSSTRLELSEHAGPHGVTPTPVNAGREDAAC